MSIPEKFIACEIKYLHFKIRCSDFRTRKDNLDKAWKMLVFYLNKEKIQIPDCPQIFMLNGGKISYYRCY